MVGEFVEKVRELDLSGITMRIGYGMESASRQPRERMRRTITPKTRPA